MSITLVGFLALIATALAFSIASSSSIFYPISDSHRSAASELFKPEFTSVEEAYEAIRSFEVLGVDKSDIGKGVCSLVSEIVGSSTSTSKNLFYALKVNGIMKCQIKREAFEGVISRLQDAVRGAKSINDFYHSIGSLVLVKGQASRDDLHLDDAEGLFRSIKGLSQSDGRWRYSFDNPESSTFAAGLALEALAGLVSLSSSEIDQSLIRTTENDILKLFDSIEKYDDGALYFDEKVVDTREYQVPISTTSAVVSGVMSFAAVSSGSLNLPADKILGLAKFFLGIGIPGDTKGFFNQLDSLGHLENNKQVHWVSIPLILSLPATVISMTKKDTLKVKVNTVLGSAAPSMTVKLVGAFITGSKDSSVIESQELKFDSKTKVYKLDALPKSLDVGKYTFFFEAVLHDPEHKKIYATESQTEIQIFITGVVSIENPEIAVLDSDLGSVETHRKLDFSGDKLAPLSANHLQKMQLLFHLTTPLGHAFKPHQVILKLTHETKVEHIFIVGNSGKKFEIVLDFLGLVEKFYYLSGRYDIQLTVGDAAMENSFLKTIGYVELDLPEAPEKATRPPPQAVDPYLRYGPKAEITHIFRAPEKLPPKELSLAFLGLVFLPFLGFLIGLLRLRVNLKNFPSSPVPATFALLFHGGIAAVLLLYVLFWVKLDLFTTLKGVGILGGFLTVVGHRILSHLASSSAKLKSA